MKGITSKLGRLIARPWRTFVPIIILFFVIALLLTRNPFNLSTSLAQAISGVSVWSTIILIIGFRVGEKILNLEDYVQLQQAGTIILMNVGPSFIAAFASDMQEKAWFPLMILSMLPCFALATITRRALFSKEEWKAAARRVP